jgi:serine phosphatase RsbU (regulator of sigma subunit)
MFGPGRLTELVATFAPDRPLTACADEARAAITRFTGSAEQQDDLTILLLRRNP